MKFDDPPPPEKRILRVISKTPLDNPIGDYDNICSAVVGNNVYCLYKTVVTFEDERTTTFAVYNLENGSFKKILNEVSEFQLLNIDGHLYRLNLYSKIMPISYFRILENEQFLYD